MKVAITSQEEISQLNSVLSEMEWLSKDFGSGYSFSDINWENYENLSKLPTHDSETFLEVLCHKIAGNHFQRIFMNLSTLLDNCADLKQTTLDFNPTIKAGFESIDLLREIDDYLKPKQKNSIFSSSILHEKIKSILAKVPVDLAVSENDG